MNPGHDLLPQDLVEIPAVAGQGFVGIVTAPHAAGVVWGVALKPHIAEIIGCSGLSGQCHAGEVGDGTRSSGENALHHIGE